MKHFEVYESNGGTLSLCILGETVGDYDQCYKIFVDWENGPKGILLDAISQLQADPTAYEDWEGEIHDRVVGLEETTQEIYDNGLGDLIAYSNDDADTGWLVAVGRLGAAGRKALDIPELVESDYDDVVMRLENRWVFATWTMDKHWEPDYCLSFCRWWKWTPAVDIPGTELDTVDWIDYGWPVIDTDGDFTGDTTPSWDDGSGARYTIVRDTTGRDWAMVDYPDVLDRDDPDYEEPTLPKGFSVSPENC